MRRFFDFAAPCAASLRMTYSLGNSPTNVNLKLSSMNFCTKKCAMVKNTGREKVRNLSDTVESIYVNPGLYILFYSPVEKSCGKTCGECGKV